MIKQIDLSQVDDIKKYVLDHEKELNFKKLNTKYKDKGTQYALDVFFSHKYLTGRDVQIACFRHLRDLQREESEECPYSYQQAYVDAIEYFVSIIPNPLDIDHPIKPYGFEHFIFDSLIGWRDDSNGGSRYHIAHISMSRKQGKTFIASALMNFFYFAEALQTSAQDFLIASVDAQHTDKLFQYVSLQADKIKDLPDFATLCKKQNVEVQATQVIGHKNQNVIRKNTVGGKQSFDSKHDLCAVFDEIGGLEPKFDRKVDDILQGQKDIPNRLFIEISTAYPDPKCRFKHEEDSLRTQLEKDDRSADSTFFLNFAQDDDSEVFDPSLWEKSNPLLADPKLKKRGTADLIDLRDTLERNGDLSGFVNKSLNIWSRQFQDSYLALRDIEKNKIDDFDITGRDIYVGVDASMTNDNTSLGFIYPTSDHTWHIEQHSFIPFAQAGSIDAKSKQDNLNYEALQEQGFCTITDHSSGTINMDQVWTWLNDYIEDNKLNLLAVVVDPAYLKNFAERVENYQPDWPYIPIRQTSFQLNEPTKNLQRAFVDGKVTILDDPLLQDGLNNAVLKQDNGGMVKIDRRNPLSDHIDTADAVINAFFRAQNHFEDFSNDDAGTNPMDKLDSDERMKYIRSLFGA